MPRPSAAAFLLAGLIVADVVLVTGALRSTHVDTAALARAAATETASPDPAAPTTRSAKTTATSADEALGDKVTITALTNTRVWRAVSPSMTCTSRATDAAISHTEDGGKHWTSVQAPMATVTGLSYADGRIIATGLDAACKATTYALSSTAAPRKVAAAPSWAINPIDLTKLLTSGKPVKNQPCTTGLLDIAANSNSDVVALCADGSVQHSINTGASWQRTNTRPGTLAIATGADSIFTATRTKCGIAVSATSAGTTNCVPGTKDWTGPVDMTIIGGTVWLATSDATATERVADVS